MCGQNIQTSFSVDIEFLLFLEEKNAYLFYWSTIKKDSAAAYTTYNEAKAPAVCQTPRKKGKYNKMTEQPTHITRW